MDSLGALESTRNPLAVSVLEESETHFESDVENQHQEFLPLSLDEDVPSTPKNNQRMFVPSILSIFGRKNHQSLPSEATPGNSPAPSPSIRSNTTSPLHNTALPSPTVVVRSIPSAPAPVAPAPLSVLDQKPEKLEGWLEKKNKSGLGSVLKMGHTWNRRLDPLCVLLKTTDIFACWKERDNLPTILRISTRGHNFH